MSALIQKDESRSFSSNDTTYNILAPTKIDVSRFVGGRVYDIVSDNQAWVSIYNDPDPDLAKTTEYLKNLREAVEKK